MKFTDGYWLQKKNVQASFAMQAFTVEEIPNGMRIAAPERPIHSRADALDITVLYLDIVSARHNDIAVTLTHHAAYETKEPRFDLSYEPDEVTVEINEKEAVMKAGDMTVRVDRETCAIRFEAYGKLLTGTFFRNLGYMRVNRKPVSYRMGPDYLVDEYEPYMLAELSVKPGETIYGFGERFTPFVKNGQTIQIWNEDGGTASDVSYKNIPFYMSSEGYAVFTDHTGPVSYEVCSEKVGYVSMSVPGEQLRFHVMTGETPAEIMEVYTGLTGRPSLPPAWSFGLWLSTSFKPKYDAGTVDSLISGMEERKIPFRVFHFDCYWMKALHWCDFVWDKEVCQDVEKMTKKYHDKGLKLCCWINPYVAQNTDMFREGAKRGYFLLRSDGHGVKQIDNWQPGMALVDFTNEESRNWFAGKVKGLLTAGIDAIKTDFGERIPIDVVYHDGSDPVQMHNYYTYLYNQTVFQAIEEVKGKGEAILFSRSATAGSQKYPVHWGGDCAATYSSMAETLRGGLSFSMSGFSFWSHDISGFEKTATPDLYKRWAQFGLLSTHSRLHGSDTFRVPWIFDEESCDVVRFFSKLKCRMMPYYYELAARAHKTGVPVMRSMPFVFPKDPACQYLDLQYMLGDSVLVAPVFNDQSLGEFYLPCLKEEDKTTCQDKAYSCGNGKWVGLIDGEILEGGHWYEKTYSYLNLPIFVREGSLLAFGSNEEVPDYDYADGTVLKFYLPLEGKISTCEIPDLTGERAVYIEAKKENDQVIFDIQGHLQNAEYEIICEDGETIYGEVKEDHFAVPI